jgi:hypothetical protein
MFDFLNTHTKVRRLGYLKLLVQQYFDKDFISTNSFNQYFEKVASAVEIRQQLENYSFYYRKDSKGIIDPLGTGTSSEPYAKLAADLSIIAKNNYSYILTKYAKVYKIVQERYQKEKSKFKFIEEQKIAQPVSLFDLNVGTGNIFVLNALDKFFFLKLLLEKDFFYLKAIISIIYKNEGVLIHDFGKYGIVKQKFLDELREQLKQYLLTPYLEKELRNKAVKLEEKISLKNLKVRSYESIIEPRISWLLDLDLIDPIKHKQEVLKLSESGKVLLDKINNIFDFVLFSENDYVKTFSLIYRLNPKIEMQIDKRVAKYLNYAFINFKTLAPNRIAASQAIEYIVVMCLLREGILLEYSEVKKYLFNLDGKGYVMDWFPSENDGSIKKINT